MGMGGKKVPINWSIVSEDHVLSAISIFDSGVEKPLRNAKNTFLIFKGKDYPAKFIRGLAYQIASGKALDPNKDFSGGLETANFFKRLGFEVGYKGQTSGKREKTGQRIVNNQSALKTVFKQEDFAGFKLGLVSFHVFEDQKCDRAKTALVAKIINTNQDLDLIVFPGWTVLNQNELDKLAESVFNNHSLFVLEACGIYKNGMNRHKAYFYDGQQVIDNEMWQYFTTSTEISKYPGTMGSFLEHLKKERKFKVKNMVGRLVICGEQNFVMNHQNEDNRVTFRMPMEKQLSKVFDEIIAGTQLFINPAHTPMGNQGKLKKRREFLSQSNRMYCFTTNNKTKDSDKKLLKKQLLKKSLQYCYFNGKPHPGIIAEHNENFILRKYEF